MHAHIFIHSFSCICITPHICKASKGHSFLLWTLFENSQHIKLTHSEPEVKTAHNTCVKFSGLRQQMLCPVGNVWFFILPMLQKRLQTSYVPYSSIQEYLYYIINRQMHIRISLRSTNVLNLMWRKDYGVWLLHHSFHTIYSFVVL